MRHREPTPIEKLAKDAGLLAHHDTERDLLRVPDETSLDALIAAADAANVWILGLEGFEVLPTGVRPDTNAIADFSSCSNAADSRREARAALQEMLGRHLAFEIELRA